MKIPHRKIIFLILLPLLLLLFGCGPQQFKSDLFSAFENESQCGPSGLAWDGKNLVMGNHAQIFLARNITTEAYHKSSVSSVLYDGSYALGRFPGPQMLQMDICGLTWEGGCCTEGFLWIADGKNSKLHQVKTNLNFVQSLPSPIENPNGIAFDGRSLWIVSSNRSQVFKLDKTHTSVDRIYNSPLQHPTGLSWDCRGYIWIIGLDACKTSGPGCYTPRLVRLNVRTGEYSEEIKLPKQILKPTSIVCVGETLWIGDYDTNRVFKISTEKSLIQKISEMPSREVCD